MLTFGEGIYHATFLEVLSELLLLGIRGLDRDMGSEANDANSTQKNHLVLVIVTLEGREGKKLVSFQ